MSGTRGTLDRSEGRKLFGLDPAGYDAARPGHPDRLYEILVERCGLRAGAAVLEIGPGTGQATRRLLELGASPLVAVEPNDALAAYLSESTHGRVEIVASALEDADLPAVSFDLAIGASSFHWVDEAIGLARLRDALRPGGWVALWWTQFGDDERPDAFIGAVDHLFDSVPHSPSAARDGRPSFGLDVDSRHAALSAAGFKGVGHERIPWTFTWDTTGIRTLYSTFSPVIALEPERRTGLLDAVAEIADEQFGGSVTKPLLTSLYTARKPS
jgi:SAM-dependent methyltransferase